MRIIIVDSDVAFTNGFAQRCKKANVLCQVFAQTNPAFAELKKDPDGVDLVLIAKEMGGGQDGLAMAQMIRKDIKTADVPYIIMSNTWAKADFAKHQKTEFGANAYYNKKTSVLDLEATIQAVTGFKFPPAPAATPSAAASAAGGNKKEGTTNILNVQLQVASEVVNFSEDVPGDISMEQPINLFEDGELPAEFAEPTAPPIIPQLGSAAPKPVAPPAPAPTAAPVAASAAQKEPTKSGVSLQIEVGTVVGKIDPIQKQMSSGPMPKTGTPEVAANVQSTSGGLEISVDAGSADEFQLEMTARPDTTKTKTPAPINAEIPPAPVETQGATGAVEISLGANDAVIETSAAPEQPIVEEAPAPVSEPVAEAPVADGESFSIAGGVMAAQELTGSKSMSSGRAVTEEEAARDLPYLFAGPSVAVNSPRISMTPSASAMVDVPVGGPLSNDVETLKKYLTMREQDVSVLSAQLSYAKEELAKGDDSIKRLTLQGEDLFHQIDDLKKKIETQTQELEHANRNREGELEQLRFEVKSKIDRIKFLEDRLNDSSQQYEKLKERVRLDIRKIRVREKELESKLEILKKDSETLIAARENKILELKRKIDLLEFNYDTLQDKNELEKQNVRHGDEKIERIQKVLKLALGIIEAEGDQATAAAAAAVAQEGLTKTGLKAAS